MAVVNLKNREIETLIVNMGDESYSIPLGGSVPIGIYKTLNTDEGFINFLKGHIPAEVVDGLLVAEIRQISAAWVEATKNSQGLTPGELQASRGS